MKREVYLNEYNIPMDNTIFLPLVSGLLQAYAQTKPVIRENYEFMPFIFIRDHPERILSRYQNPSVAAFSASMWNINLSLAVAQRVKEKFPRCLIVFGGPQMPHEATDLIKLCPFMDITARGEGERIFADLLVRFLDTGDFTDIPGISYRDGGNIIRNDKEYPLAEDLAILPSPYLEGLFDQLLASGMNFQAIVETNRGCPFLCSFCFWSQGSKRYRFYSLDRVRRVIDWCGVNKIRYVFCADSNFGMIKRDLEIANYVVETKAKYGFPEKFRACYGKNAEENIFRIGKLLTEHQLIKGISIARQSNNPQTLKNIRRKNIKMSVYNNLQKRYSKDNIPTYTELILGLPGETYESFLRGIEEVLEATPKSQLFIYPLQVYPNTELADPHYQQRFGIKTVRLPLNEVHASIRMPGEVMEYEELVVSTTTMPVDDWKRAVVVSWVVQLLHGLKLGFYILTYLFGRYHIKYTDFYQYIALLKANGEIFKDEVQRFYRLSDSILQGKAHGQVMPDFGPIYWEPEEASYLHIATKKEAFYREFYLLVREYLDGLNIAYASELREVVEYQKARIPDLYLGQQEYRFEYSIPELFDFTKGHLSRLPQVMVLDNAKDYKGDKKAFAQEVVIYGRKSDKMLHSVRWR